MADTARMEPTQRKSGLPEEIVVSEILVRLPAKSLLRCRAVCRSFRRLTSADDFLVAHHIHQPCLHLVSRVHGGQDLLAFDHRVSPASAPTRASAASSRLLPVAPLRHPGFQVRASCDGLLLISLKQASFYVCNPATRQWALLPFFPNFLGFYRHHASGEYRLLYGGDRPQNPNADDQAVYYVQTVGSRNRRCIGRPVARSSREEESAYVEEALAKGVVEPYHYHPSVLLHDNLHFYPVENQSNNTNMILAFSTTAEMFWWMPAAMVRKSSGLFEMDGKLALSSKGDGETVLDIWVLQDYESEVWEFKYCIVLPLAWERFFTEHRHFVTIFLCEKSGVLVSNYRKLLHVDIEGKVLENIHYPDQALLVVPHRLKESLIHHPFFPRKQDDEAGQALLSPFM